MKRVLITGVTGQDGSYLSDLILSNEQYEVYGLARRVSTANTSRIQHLLNHPRFKLIRGDVTDAGFMYRLIAESGFDEVYNLAAQSFVGTSYDEPTHTSQVNFNGCLNCLEAIRSIPSNERPRFYQASTSEMFGTMYTINHNCDECPHRLSRHFDYRDIKPIEIEAGCCEWWNQGADRSELVEKFKETCVNSHVERLEVWQDENTPFRPSSPYAIAKLAAHQLVNVYRQAYGIFACSGILFNHESPRRGEEFVTRKITKYLGKLVAKGFDKVGALKLGNIDAYRDWGHAKDYVAGQVLMLRADRPDDYVLATGESHSVREFLQCAFGELGLKWENYVEISQSELRPTEVPYLRGDASKAKTILGWSPSIPFEKLVRDMLYADIGRESQVADRRSFEVE